jgi:hypothetical protein
VHILNITKQIPSISRLKELRQELPSDASSETDEDEEAELLTEDLDRQILATLARYNKVANTTHHTPVPPV